MGGSSIYLLIVRGRRKGHARDAHAGELRVARGNGLEEGRGTRGFMHTVLLEAGHEVGLEALVVQPPLVQLRLEVSNLRFRAEVSGIYAAHSEVPAKSWSRPRLPPSHAFQNEAGKVSPPPPFSLAA